MAEQIFDRSPKGRRRYIRFAFIYQALPFPRCCVVLLAREIDILAPNARNYSMPTTPEQFHLIY